MSEINMKDNKDNKDDGLILEDNSDLFVNNELVNIKIFYKKVGKMFSALTQREFNKKKQENPRFNESEYKEINLWVVPLTWGVFNNLQQSSRELDEFGVSKFNSKMFKENKIVTVIKRWDIKRKTPDGNLVVVPINHQTVSTLSPEIAETILTSYDEYMILDEEEEKK